MSHAKPQAKAQRGGRGRKVSGRQPTAASSYTIKPTGNAGKLSGISVRTDHPARKGGERGDHYRKKRGLPKGKASMYRAIVPMQQSFINHVRACRNPFDGTKVLPFHTFNPEPSLIATPGFASSLRTFNVLPGHNIWVVVGGAYNYNLTAEAIERPYTPTIHTAAGLAQCAIGPIGYGIGTTLYPSLAVVQTGITATNPNFTTSCAVTADQYTWAMEPTQAWPISANINAGTLRWAPICWGVRIRRISKLVDAAGDWHIVLPPNRLGLGLEITDKMMRDVGSFKMVGSEGGEWSVPARPADLFYSRTVGIDAFRFTDPAFIANYTNASDATASYEVEVTLKYAVAGDAQNALGTPVDHAPQHAGALEAASAAVTSGLAPGHGIEALATAAHAAAGTGNSVLEAVSKAAKAINIAVPRALAGFEFPGT